MYDLIVLGGGPGGYEAASLAAAKGLSVCLIEKKFVGGTCLNEGCIPLKYYLHGSKVIKELETLRGQGVISGGDVTVNQKQVVANKDAIVGGLRQSVGAKLDFNKVEVVSAEGVVKSADESKVTLEAGGQILEASKLIIAAGSVERKINFAGNATIPVLYSSDLLKLETVPNSMVVIGAGVIGLEAASYFADLGVKVTLVDVAKTIGGAIDSEIEKAYERILKKNGVTLMLQKGVNAINDNRVVLEGGESVETELVLVAVGRMANVNGIGLENTSIAFGPKGVEIDEHCRTNLSNVYAIGDVTGKLMLAHTAYHQAAVCVDNILGKERKCEYGLIPQIIYANPEITTVGLTEDAAKEQGLNYVAKSIPMTYSGKYYAEHGRDGALIKMVVEADTKRVLGFSIVGNTGSEIGLFFELVIKMKLTVDDLDMLIYPHPTMGEVIKELAEQF